MKVVNVVVKASPDVTLTASKQDSYWMVIPFAELKKVAKSETWLVAQHATAEKAVAEIIANGEEDAMALTLVRINLPAAAVKKTGKKAKVAYYDGRSDVDMVHTKTCQLYSFRGMTLIPGAAGDEMTDMGS